MLLLKNERSDINVYSICNNRILSSFIEGISEALLCLCLKQDNILLIFRFPSAISFLSFTKQNKEFVRKSGSFRNNRRANYSKTITRTSG